jgi:hypothetical protein
MSALGGKQTLRLFPRLLGRRDPSAGADTFKRQLQLRTNLVYRFLQFMRETGGLWIASLSQAIEVRLQ